MPKQAEEENVSAERQRLKTAFDEGGSVIHNGQLYERYEDLPDTVDDPESLVPANPSTGLANALNRLTDHLEGAAGTKPEEVPKSEQAPAK